MAIPQTDDQTLKQIDEPTAKKPLRLWPGVAAAVLLLLIRFVVPVVKPEALPLGIIGAVLAALLIVVWWLFFSRALWSERLGAIALIIIAMFATSRLIHVSISNGAMGFLFPVLAIPIVTLALVGWAVASRRLANWPRRATLVGVILLTCSVFALIRTGGFTGDANSDFHWRWTKTPEERLLAQADEPVAAALPPVVAKTGADWPGFRGPGRDSVVHGTRIRTDWAASPPVELWRRPIGPAWSSFAVSGDLFYTQEQRGDDELVTCYSVTTGKPVWRHSDAARFWESNGGAGPRGTPTLDNGHVYTLGGTGILNALDAGNGSVLWSRNAATDTNTKLPGWGFASSPIVVDNLVVVATAGTLAAYDVATGAPRWVGPKGGGSYSSPHLVTLHGVPQILLLSATGAISVSPADGKPLWELKSEGSTRIVQPALTADGDVLIHDGEGGSMHRIAVSLGTAGWTTTERWSSDGLKPYFNDFVVHNGYAFGFDGSSIACIDLKDGALKWTGGHYGHGQLVLLADQNLLLVLSEDGKLALVGATADQFTELARFPAIEGKTWNHPVLIRDVLLVRNGQEMVAFRLSPEGH